MHSLRIVYAILSLFGVQRTYFWFPFQEPWLEPVIALPLHTSGPISRSRGNFFEVGIRIDAFFNRLTVSGPFFMSHWTFLWPVAPTLGCDYFSCCFCLQGTWSHFATPSVFLRDLFGSHWAMGWRCWCWQLGIPFCSHLLALLSIFFHPAPFHELPLVGQ